MIGQYQRRNQTIGTSRCRVHTSGPANRRGRGITRGQALLAAVVFCLAFYLLSGLVFATAEHRPVQPHIDVTVKPGDSLWKLAERYCERAGTDTAALVEAIREQNGLADAVIYPGQTLHIPLQPDR